MNKQLLTTLLTGVIYLFVYANAEENKVPLTIETKDWVLVCEGTDDPMLSKILTITTKSNGDILFFIQVQGRELYIGGKQIFPPNGVPELFFVVLYFFGKDTLEQIKEINPEAVEHCSVINDDILVDGINSAYHVIDNEKFIVYVNKSSALVTQVLAEIAAFSGKAGQRLSEESEMAIGAILKTTLQDAGLGR